MRYWLLKSEPSTYGIDALAAAPKRTTSWQGVRNYQARNMLRDEIKRGDQAFFYHSSCPEPGIAGVVEVVRAGYPDASAWDPSAPAFDAKSPENKPIWYTIDVRLKQRWPAVLPLATLREHADGALRDMVLLQRGSRLSVTPVTAAQWKFILAMRA
jgi:predicted RNA-binding protein with PUA-like domain